MELTTVRSNVFNWFRGLADRAGLLPHGEPTAANDGVLPNFCSVPVVVNVMLIAEVFAFITTLITRRISLNILEDLLLISLFLQWIALTSIACLCGARSYLNRLPRLKALALAYALLLVVTLVVSEAAVWLLYAFGRISTARPEWYGYFHIQNFTVSVLVNALALRYLLGKHELKQRTLSEARAKIQALQSRIRPHFVFNSLNIIASLTRNEPARAESAIEDMADLFRMMLTEDEQLIPVKKEVDVTKKYLAIETLRLEQRLHVEWQIGTFPRKAAIPVLTLQPLLENAVRHGVEALPAGGTIHVKLWEQDDKIHIQVDNPYPPAKSKSAPASHSRSLDNIRSRLESHYGQAARLEAKGENGQFSVSVVIPTRGGNV
ncbi:MAG: histidine kinase [Gammaproteobacteria bacterium]|nr:histidine kinase [Gammaproteobacteria bacterium]